MAAQSTPGAATGDWWRRRLGRFGVWLPPVREQVDGPFEETAAELESLGYGAVWLGGSAPRPADLERFSRMARATSHLVGATGILSIWHWEPADLVAELARLDAEHPGRFLLGLGVSHAPLVEQAGQRYERPVEVMAGFLDRLDGALERAPDGGALERAPASAGASGRVLAALGPRMLGLARERAVGVHPYFVPPEHSAEARAILGPDRLVCPEVAVVLERDAGRARERARRYMAIYLSLDNYRRNLRRLGFDEGDLDHGGSDRLIDALIAWGDEDAVAAKLGAHLAAGADHLAVQPVADQANDRLVLLRRLSPLLGSF